MASLQYINSKLSDAIYILTIHEGDARTRLAKVLPKLRHLPPSSFPNDLQKEFTWVRMTIERGIGKQTIDTPPPHKLTKIKNITARKVIEKLVFIHNKINSIINDEHSSF